MVRKPPFWWLVIPVLLFVFVYGGLNLDTTPIFDDEWDSIDDVGGIFSPARSFTDIALNLAETNPWHAPGYYWVLKVWIILSGPEPAAIRLLTLLTGLLSVALIYRLGSELSSSRMAVFAAVLLGFSILFVFYLTKVRMYVQLVFLAEAVLYFYFAYWRKRQTWLLFALAASVTGLLYTHYISVAMLVALCAYHLFFQRWNKNWWKVTLAIALGGLSFLPWVQVLAAGITSETSLSRPGISSLAVVGNFLTIFGNNSIVLGGILIIVGLYGAARTAAGRRLIFLALITLGVLLALNEAVTPMSQRRLRYLIVLLPPMILFVAYGLERVRQGIRLGSFVVMVLLGFLGLGSIIATMQRSLNLWIEEFDYIFPMHSVHQQIGDRVQSDDMVVYFLPDDSSVGEVKFSRENAAMYEEFTAGHHTVTMTEFYPGQADEERRTWAQLAEGYNRVWLAAQPNRPINGFSEFRESLAQTHVLCPDTAHHSNVTVEQFVRYSPVCCVGSSQDMQPQLQFGDWFSVVDSEIQMSDDSGAVDVVLAWRMSDGAPIHVYSATLQLFNEGGDKVAQSDYGLDATAFSCKSVQFDVASLPPGTYLIVIDVYNWQTGETLPTTDPASGDIGTMWPLDSIVIND